MRYGSIRCDCLVRALAPSRSALIDTVCDDGRMGKCKIIGTDPNCTRTLVLARL